MHPRTSRRDAPDDHLPEGQGLDACPRWPALASVCPIPRANLEAAIDGEKGVQVGVSRRLRRNTLPCHVDQLSPRLPARPLLILLLPALTLLLRVLRVLPQLRVNRPCLSVAPPGSSTHRTSFQGPRADTTRTVVDEKRHRGLLAQLLFGRSIH